MWFRYRTQILTSVAVVVVAAAGFFAWQQLAPGGESSSPSPSPSSVAPPDSSGGDPATQPSVPVDNTPVNVDVTPAELVEVEKMLQVVGELEDIQAIVSSLDNPNGVRTALEQMAVVAEDQYSDAVLTTKPIRPGSVSECAGVPCLVVPLVISVPSVSFTTELPLVAVKQGDRWVATRASLCAVVDLTTVTCY
jgi:hypothetical protein